MAVGELAQADDPFPIVELLDIWPTPIQLGVLGTEACSQPGIACRSVILAFWLGGGNSVEN